MVDMVLMVAASVGGLQHSPELFMSYNCFLLSPSEFEILVSDILSVVRRISHIKAAK